MTGISVPLTDLSRLVAAKDLVSRDLAGETVILNLENGVYYGMNSVGARVWNLVQEPRTFAEVRDTLVEEYDVEAGALETDLRVLVAQLAEGGLIEIEVASPQRGA